MTTGIVHNKFMIAARESPKAFDPIVVRFARYFGSNPAPETQGSFWFLASGLVNSPTATIDILLGETQIITYSKSMHLDDYSI